MGNLGQKWPAKRLNVVLPEIKSYPDIAWDMGTENLPGSLPCKSFNTKKSLFALFLLLLSDEITVGHITQLLGADFD